MDFQYPLPLWGGTTVSEDKSISDMLDLNSYFTAHPPPMQGPSTATQDPFPFHPSIMEQYLLSSSTVSDSSFSTQEMEFPDPIQQYLTFSPSESYHTLPDLAALPYESQNCITVSELSFALGRPSTPIPTPPTNQSHGQYAAVPTMGNSHPVLMGWPGEDLMGVSHSEEGKGEKDRRLETFMDSSPKREERYPDLINSYGSDEVSNENPDDQSYHPSPVSSSPSNGQYSPFSYNADNSPTRGSSKSTLNEESPGSSPFDDGEGYKRTTGSRRKSKGKAKGSAALALAKLTLKNNKPLTGPFGTFVPYPPELSKESDVMTYGGDGTIAGVRLGRKRRNGHIPPPVVVPDLVKRSRGRKVPSSRAQAGTQSEVPRPFVCEVERCGASFTRREHLKRHSRSLHTNEKEYICPEPSCGKSFNRRDNLAQHSRIHLIDADSCVPQGPADSDGSPYVGST